MKYGFSEASPYPQPNGIFRATQRLNGLEEDVEFLPGTSIRVWYTHQATCYPPHWHRCMEIIECVHSHYTVQTEKETYTVSPGEILALPGGVVHDLQPGEDCNGWIYLFDLAWLNGIPSCRNIASRLTRPILLSRQTMPTAFSKAASLLSRMRNDYFSDNPMREALFDSSVLRLLEQLTRMDETEAENAFLDKRHEHDALFDQVTRYIDEHFAEDLTLTGLSRRFNLSSAYFSRLFKQYAHDSFSGYLASRRFTEADRLLMDPTIPITEVAFRCGYNSPAVFSRAFLAQRKCSPSKFRHIYARFEMQRQKHGEEGGYDSDILGEPLFGAQRAVPPDPFRERL
ncbi:MAG: helix-turn-helix transcriptional regulator [Clostridia bacterium]|nr:helix-turn-helix transcriptional regulator [Clostridia bacterium]